MKKSILFIILIIVPMIAFGQVFKDDATITDKAKDKIQAVVGCDCPKYEIKADTPIAAVQREELDLSFRYNFFDYASLGGFSFNNTNFDIQASLNLNKVLYVYGWWGQRYVAHDKIDRSAFEQEWQYQYAMAGIGFYFNPVMKVFGGGGKVIKADNNGDDHVDDYGTMIEYGVAFDKELSVGYKVELGWRFVKVPFKDEVALSELPAKGDYQAVSVAITVPFSLW
jgi:hypothetical protein